MRHQKAVHLRRRLSHTEERYGEKSVPNALSTWPPHCTSSCGGWYFDRHVFKGELTKGHFGAVLP
ncbi:hypothetical protein OO25_01605 [Phaeobacter sp. S60]|nr:hypothetical protein OO25_01605 [Phaeobacter sp. S60]